MSSGKVKHGQFQDAWKRLKRNKRAIVGMIILLLIILGALLAGVIGPEGFDEHDYTQIFQKPSWKHLCGTDNFGRDIFHRILYGGRISLVVGFCAVVVSVSLGTVLGSVAGYYGGAVDNIIMRFMDVMMAIPNTLLAIAVCAALGSGIDKMILAIAITAVPGHSRVVRSAVLSARHQEYIEAAVSNGASDARIIFKYILPNCLAPIIVQATMSVARAILSASSLAFIGLGVQQPTPEWGAMLSAGRNYIRDYWWVITFPGVAIMLTIYGINLFGDGLRDALDPRLKQ